MDGGILLQNSYKPVRSYPVKEKPIGSAVSIDKLKRHLYLNRYTFKQIKRKVYSTCVSRFIILEIWKYS